MKSLEELKKEAREEMYVELEAHTRLNGNDPMDADGMELALSYLDTLIDKAFTAGEKAGLKEGFDNGYEAVTGEVIVRSNTSS